MGAGVHAPHFRDAYPVRHSQGGLQVRDRPDEALSPGRRRQGLLQRLVTKSQNLKVNTGLQARGLRNEVHDIVHPRGEKSYMRRKEAELHEGLCLLDEMHLHRLDEQDKDTLEYKDTIEY